MTQMMNTYTLNQLQKTSFCMMLLPPLGTQTTTMLEIVSSCTKSSEETPSLLDQCLRRIVSITLNPTNGTYCGVQALARTTSTKA